MTNKYKLLSYFLDDDTPLYGTTRPIKIKQDRQIKKGDSCNTALITFSNHSGTHIDAPRHFYDTGKCIADYKINELIFNSPLIVDCPKKPDEFIMPSDLKSVRKCDLLLLRTGFYRYRNNIKYCVNNPGISHETAAYIRRRHPYIKAIGIDTISISTFKIREEGRKAHKFFLSSERSFGKPVCIIEDMDLGKNLEGLKKVYVVPIFFRGVDSMPCTIIGEFRG